MQLVEVTNDQTRRQFLEVPLAIYKDDPNWIRPLDKDIEFVFNKEKNKFWKHGTAARWVLHNAKGEPIGRVAAFIDENTAHTFDQPTGGMGFFECINDPTAANFMFDHCKAWLEARGMEAMDGPINFGERGSWWGLLVDGFIEPTYQMNYNPPYYKALFEGYGFQLYFRQLVYYRHLQEPAPKKFVEKYDKLMEDPGYAFRHAKKSRIRKFAKDFRIIYNKAWAGRGNFKEMDYEQALTILKKIKPILAEELAWFGYYKEDPIAFFIMIPDMNQIFKRYNGKFGLWEKIKTWWYLKRMVNTRCYGILFGIVPEHQGKGVEGGIVTAASHVIHPQNHWGHMEMIWIGDFNPKMMHVAESVGGEVRKVYWTMRYLFDRTKPFERAPLWGSQGKSEASELPISDSEKGAGKLNV